MRLKVKGTTLKAEVKSFERQTCLWTEGLAEHAGVVDRAAVTCQGTQSCLQGKVPVYLEERLLSVPLC